MGCWQVTSNSGVIMLQLLRDGRTIGLIAAVSAVALGLLYMALAGAPKQLLLMNLAALGIGLVLFVIASKFRFAAEQWRGALLVGLALCILATSLFGVTAEGATRWAMVAGLTIQPSLIVAPLLCVAYAGQPDRSAALALLIAVVATAMQPDRAVATMLLSGIAVAAIAHRDRQGAALTGLAALGFAATLLQPDNLSAVPYVDQILSSPARAHPLAGVAVWLGTVLLFAPVLSREGGKDPGIVALVAVWGAAIVAALLHNYPTPLVGYGASPIIGYLLSLLVLQKASAASADGSVQSGLDEQETSDHSLNFA
jgi:hypothetical protein